MADSEIVARFKARYREEAARSAKDPDTARLRPGSVSWNEEIARPLAIDDPGTAEKLYLWAIEEATRIEEESGMRVKKGVEYCNLAVAQKNQGRLREAYVNFELAEREDLLYGDASHAGLNVLEGHLLLPAGDALVSRVNEFVDENGLDRSLVERARQLWVRIGREDRFRLRQILPQCLTLAEATTSETSFRLESWRTLAVLAEDVLRRKYPSTLPAPDMQALLRREFGNNEANVVFNLFLPKHGRVTETNVDAQIADSLQWTSNPLNNAMIVFYVVRNYTAHWVRSAVKCVQDPTTFVDVLTDLCAFASRIEVPVPTTGPFSRARLPIGVSTSPFPATTPTWPDPSISAEWAAQVAVALTGLKPTQVSVDAPFPEVHLTLRFAESPPNSDALVEYLTSGIATGGHFAVSVMIES